MDSRLAQRKTGIKLTIAFAILHTASRVDAMPLYTLTNFGSAIPVAIDDTRNVAL